MLVTLRFFVHLRPFLWAVVWHHFPSGVMECLLGCVPLFTYGNIQRLELLNLRLDELFAVGRCLSLLPFRSFSGPWVKIQSEIFADSNVLCLSDGLRQLRPWIRRVCGSCRLFLKGCQILFGAWLRPVSDRLPVCKFLIHLSRQ